jgi:hypothetical protein
MRPITALKLLKKQSVTLLYVDDDDDDDDGNKEMTFFKIDEKSKGG